MPFNGGNIETRITRGFLLFIAIEKSHKLAVQNIV